MQQQNRKTKSKSPTSRATTMIFSKLPHLPNQCVNQSETHSHIPLLLAACIERALSPDKEGVTLPSGTVLFGMKVQQVS